MGFAKLSLRKNDQTSKYILFYAEYLHEAWLSKVNEADETTSIVKQFRCKSQRDLDKLADYIAAKGELINLAASENPEAPLQLLEKKLINKPNENFSIWKFFNLDPVFPKYRFA